MNEDVIHGSRPADVDEESPLLPRNHVTVEGTSNSYGTAPSGWARLTTRAKQWFQGPQPPQIQTINPILPELQQAPIKLLHRLLPKYRQRATLLACFLLTWMVAFSIPLIISSLPAKDATGKHVVNIDCIDALWGFKNQCGLDGIDCGPFTNQSLSFRCPANCAGVRIVQPRYIGGARVNYQPLVIGGPDHYRGDSFICSSAIHAGVVSNSRGGCGRLDKIGTREAFPASFRHGISSISFDSYFPLSFAVFKDATIDCGVGDIRDLLLVVSLFFTVTLSTFTTDPGWFFFPAFIGIFAHVGLVSMPPIASYRNTTVLPDHISLFAERLLPAAFCAAVMYRIAIKRTLTNLGAHFEKTTLWLGGFWIGALENYTFSRLHVRRLIAPEPGPRLSLSLLVLAIIVPQIHSFRLEGRLPRYLALYALLGASTLLIAHVPGLTRHVHHYTYALMLLPGTSLQTRPSLLFQGVLLGLFVNGTARWGFASVLETPASQIGDGAYGFGVPQVGAPVITAVAQGVWSVTFRWARPSAMVAVDAVSVLVNDVERERAFFVDGNDTFTWSRVEALNLPEYFRFGYVRAGVALDYTAPGTWLSDGSWKK